MQFTTSDGLITLFFPFTVIVVLPLFCSSVSCRDVSLRVTVVAVGDRFVGFLLVFFFSSDRIHRAIFLARGTSFLMRFFTRGASFLMNFLARGISLLTLCLTCWMCFLDWIIKDIIVDLLIYIFFYG